MTGLKTVFAPSGKSLWKKSVRQSKMVSVDFNMFLDRPGVGERLLKKEKKILGITGNYTMNAVRWSMRKFSPREDKQKRQLRKKGKHQAARKIGADKPPRYREGSLRRMTYYGLDPNGYAVVIGPYAFSGSSLTTPEVLHYGGRKAVVLPKSKFGNESRRRESAIYLPRPFAGGSDAYYKGEKRFVELQEEIPL